MTVQEKHQVTGITERSVDVLDGTRKLHSREW